MKKRTMSILVTVLMGFAMMTMGTGPVFADGGIPYCDADGSVKSVPAGQYREAAASDASWSEQEKPWIVVTRDVELNNHVAVKGSVNLVLCDGATLTAKKGIKVEEGNTLAIFAQSTENKGKLIATGEEFKAGIGGSDRDYSDKHCGTIVINGGNIDATGGKNAAGIGGGWNGDGGKITINGGVIQAKGGVLAAGIGGGRYGNGGTFNMTGGTITSAEAGDTDDDNSSGAGIGGGQGQDEDGDYGGGYGGTINITGGVIEKAKGGYSGAGIGGGVWGDGGKITISGDAVINNARGGKNGAGIGGGYKGKGEKITISGGRIEKSIGGDRAAGIGGGYLGDGGTITITGGTITHTEGGFDHEHFGVDYDGGAGIGGGGKGDSGNITIKGDAHIVSAIGQNNGAGIGGGGFGGNGNTISIEENAVIDEARGNIGGAGIGSGGDKPSIASVTLTAGTINISGGKVSAFGGINGGAAIGGGDRGMAGTITISGGEVTAKTTLEGTGIGSGRAPKSDPADDTGTIRITGGTVIAQGGDGAGIGGGYKRSAKVVITGGTVKAQSAQGAGIGGGFARNGGTIEISGGAVVEARGGSGGAGIGGGGGNSTETGGAGGKITISGADTIVNASSKEDGAGIGGGSFRSGGTITINDGTVTAQGGKCAAGIGGGSNLDSHGSDNRGHGGTITINGGKITAVGGDSGAGIGGGGGVNFHGSTSTLGGDGGKITITGGEVEATGSVGGAGIGGGGGMKIDRSLPGAGGAGGTIEIRGGSVSATGEIACYSYGTTPILVYTSGAGIGGGSGGAGGTVTIRGGTVNAKAPENPNYGGVKNKSAAIGGGEGASSGKISISGGTVAADGMLVGIGCGEGGSASDGDGLQLTYSDSTMADMSITASNYNCSVTIDSGKTFSDGFGNQYTGNLSDANRNAIAGETIIPIVPGTTEAVTYLGTDGEEKGPVSCEIIKATSEEKTLNDTGITKGWYSVKDSKSTGVLKISGSVNLILRDYAELSPEQISIESKDSTLTIWAQSTGNDRGKLTAANTNRIIAGTGALTINGGTVNLNATTGQGVSIDGVLLVNGGDLTVTAKSTGIVAGGIAVTGGKVSACGEGEGYGITIRNGGKAIFSGGTVEASGKTALHLVSGKSDDLELAGMMVYPASENAEAVPAAERANTCMNTGYAKIVTCTHSAKVYTDNGEGKHSASCKYCSDTDGTLYDHTYSDHVCVCGAKQPTHTVTFYANNGTEEKAEQTVYDGEETSLEKNRFSLANHTFAGWNTVQNPTGENPGKTYKDGEKVTLTDDLSLYGQWKLIPEPPKPALTPIDKKQAKISLDAGLKGTSAKGTVTARWGKVKEADSYDVYAAYCEGNSKYKKIKTVSAAVNKFVIKKLSGKKLKPKRCVKYYVVAYKNVNGKRMKLAKSLDIHVVGSGNAKQTNIKSIHVPKKAVTLKKGKTAKVKAKLVLYKKRRKTLDHVAKFRYASSNENVAKVSKKGTVKAVGKGRCEIYVYAQNGCAKKMKVTVK